MATSGIAKGYLERDGLKWHHNFKFTCAQSDFCTQYVFRKCMYKCKDNVFVLLLSLSGNLKIILN